MWWRKTKDPLGKLLFEKYSMHVLNRPRENVSVFQVFSMHGIERFLSGTIDGFLRHEFNKPEVEKGEILVDIDGTFSDAISGNIAIDFLRGFLTILSAAIESSVSVALVKSETQSLRFRFGGCTRDYVKDGFDLDWKLSEVPFIRENSAMREDYRYYIATGVHFCNKLTFVALDKNLNAINLSTELEGIASAKANLSFEKDNKITAASDKTLAYGVELNEIIYDEKRKRLRLQESKDYIHVMGASAMLPKAMVGGPEDSIILQIAN